MEICEAFCELNVLICEPYFNLNSNVIILEYYNMFSSLPLRISFIRDCYSTFSHPKVSTPSYAVMIISKRQAPKFGFIAITNVVCIMD